MNNSNDDFEKDVIQRLTKIETKIEDLSSVKDRNEIAYNLSRDNKERLDALEDNNKWFYRTAVGALISSIVALAFTLIKSGLIH